MRRFKYRDNGFGQLSPVKLRHRIWRRLTDWRQRAPKSFWLSLLAALVLTGGTVAFIFIRNYTFTRQLNYSPCDIKYGETVAGWDGQGEGQWDQKGYRYEVKKFQLKASAPERIFPNVVEQPPTRLQTSRLADTPGCQPDFSGLIDINSDQYQWFGAKAQAARLGVPDLGQTNNSGRITSIDPSTRLDKKLSPPLFQDS
ncbi:hypothetical protein HY441_01185, partial [Candidatus Microgenomates bacterium]|nr:hypothetical protein [Candidatus Microgenomates bacterium]